MTHLWKEKSHGSQKVQRKIDYTFLIKRDDRTLPFHSYRKSPPGLLMQISWAYFFPSANSCHEFDTTPDQPHLNQATSLRTDSMLLDLTQATTTHHTQSYTHT